jgi:hypothetical protein
MKNSIDRLRELAIACPTEYPPLGAWGDVPEVKELSAALRQEGYTNTANACFGGKAWPRKVLHSGDVLGMHIVEQEASEPHWSWNRKDGIHELTKP